MTIYKKSNQSKVNYREIYEQHHGPIPNDDTGRTFEIHHIDGDRKNNNPDNLVALSIQDHYDVHYSQSDWGACLLIASRMTISPDEKSTMARAAAMKRVENGTHHFLKKSDGSSLSKTRVERKTHNFQTREDGTSLSSDRVKDGTHHFLGGEISMAEAKKRIADGTHHFLQSEWQRENQLTRLENGTHNFLDTEWNKSEQRRRVDNRTHNFLGPHSNTRMLVEGIHPSQKQWACEHCGKSGNGVTNYIRWHGDNCKNKNKRQ